MSADPEQFTRDELADRVDDQHDEITALRAEVQALDARTDALARQLALVRMTIAGGDDAFWSLKRHGEGHNIVARLEQFEATLDGFAERFRSIEEGGKP